MTILALVAPDQPNSSSRRHFFPTPEAKTTALTRARKAVFVVGRGHEMESSDDAKDILAFATSQYDDESKNANLSSSLDLSRRSMYEVQTTISSALAPRSVGVAAGPSWGGSFYSAPSSNYATPSMYQGIGGALAGAGGGGGGGGSNNYGYQPVSFVSDYKLSPNYAEIVWWAVALYVCFAFQMGPMASSSNSNVQNRDPRVRAHQSRFVNGVESK